MLFRSLLNFSGTQLGFELEIMCNMHACIRMKEVQYAFSDGVRAQCQSLPSGGGTRTKIEIAFRLNLNVLWTIIEVQYMERANPFKLKLACLHAG